MALDCTGRRTRKSFRLMPTTRCLASLRRSLLVSVAMRKPLRLLYLKIGRPCTVVWWQQRRRRDAVATEKHFNGKKSLMSGHTNVTRSAWIWFSRRSSCRTPFSGGEYLHPRQVLRELEKAMPEDVMVSTDIGNINSVANSYLRFEKPRSFFAAMSFGNCNDLCVPDHHWCESSGA